MYKFYIEILRWPKRRVPKLLLMMKLTILLLTVTMLQVSASTFGQKLNLTQKNVTLKQVFKAIKKQTGYDVLYQPGRLNASVKINANFVNTPLDEVIKNCIDGKALSYIFFEKTIVIKAAEKQAGNNSTTGAGSVEVSIITVKGIVIDSTGRPIPGATVKLKDGSKGTMSDADGKFELKDVPSAGVLLVTSIGYLQQEIGVNNQTTLRVVLKETSRELSQVVVIGYGSQKKSDVTGAIISVSKQRLENLPVTNILQSIEGAVPGINITSGSSAPGSVSSIYVRGLHSITASNSPLVVLDGVPYNGSYNDINTNDVESVQVLKDASATAIYGTRGSNGVIIVTTKKGKTGKPSVQYNAWAGPEYMSHEVKPMGGAEYVQKNLDYDEQAGKTAAPVPNLYEQDNYKNGKETDWIKAISQQGFIQNHSLNVSGGTADVKYYVSGDYTKEKGILKGYQFNRFNVRGNLDAKITDWLNAGTNMFFNNNNYDGGKSNLYMATVMSPYGQEYNAQGDYQIYPMYPDALYTNPLLGLYQPTVSKNRTWNGNFYAEIKPAFIKGFKYRLNTGYAYNPAMTGDYTGRNTGDAIGHATMTNAESNHWLIENIVNYSRSFGKHSIDFTGLYSSQKDYTLSNALNANTFINDLTNFYNLGSAQIQQTTSSYTQSTLLSQMARINYSYAGKYLFTATARRDGFSGFSAANKYGTFPSVAVAWNLTEESFMKGVSAISALKLRASYGISGNQEVSSYNTLTTLASTQYIYGSTTTIGLNPSAIGNGNLKWESTKGFNFGIDFSILKDRISGSVDAYDTKTYNLLLSRKIPYITGYTTILDNIGRTANKGIEFSITSRNIQNSDFSWETNVNFSANRNKLVQLYGDNKDDITNNLFLGKQLQAVYDYKLIGVWQKGDDFTVDPSAKPGDLKFADLNGDGKINTADKTYLGSRLPKYIAGMTNTFRYKSFSLSAFVQTFQGALKPNPIYDYRDQAGRINLPAGIGYWTAANQSNTRPSLSYTNSRQYTYPVSGSYTRIKDVTLSYSFSKEVLRDLKISNLQVYASGRNIATFSKWLGWDPETDFYNYAGNQSSSFYPLVATVVLGVNITLQ
ncbi:SusC/RagA family TonB-linked outer membrane protein [Mucilaginibacter rubeus]|uniref:TonB-dependent receptor n=1 Tax=Mucilaginibacter rubeus TaxID=2027860 RepID=A0A5C1HZR1_9SPHI|nr:TonB-dependent receptor [Mucilaginibacter rubeus]QEM10418.1 TonB-dependent receptor [Mucilaginibacter rubeus]